MILQLPRLRVIAACGVAACACASALGAYFGADCGGGLAFIGCWLLFVSALSLHPGRAQWIAAAALSALFAAMRTLGASYDAIDSYGLMMLAIMILVFVVLGGIGSIRGSMIAAVILTLLPEMLRGLSDYRMLIYAIVLIVMMLFNWAPKAIEWREKNFSFLRLRKKKEAVK